MTDIKLVNEGGTIVAYDRDTGEQVPVELQDLHSESVDAGKVSAERAVSDEAAVKRLKFDYSDTYPQFPTQPERGSFINVQPHPNVENPVVTKADVTDVTPNSGVADPIPGWNDALGQFEMFCELVGTGNGNTIGRFTSQDGVHWDYQQEILKADPPHAFPYWNIIDGTLYLTPTNNSENFDIYTADPTDIPGTLSFEETAIVLTDIGDPIWWWAEDENGDGRYWLLCQDDNSRKVFYSDIVAADASPVGRSWTSHPQNPVPAELPGGRPTVRDGRVHYVDHIMHQYAITELTTSSFAQQQLDEGIIAGAQNNGQWNGANMHALSLVPGDVSGEFDPVIVDGYDGDEWSVGVYVRSSTPPSGAVLHPSSSTDIPDTTPTIVPMDTPEHDVTGAVGGNGYTVPYSGYYRVSSTIRFQFGSNSTADSRIRIRLIASGAAAEAGEICTIHQYPPTTSDIYSLVVPPRRVYLQQGANVVAEVQQFTGDTITADPAAQDSFLQVEWAGE